MKKPKIYKYTSTVEFRTENYNKIKNFRTKLNSLFRYLEDTEEIEFKIISIKKSESITIRSAKNKAVKLQNWVAKKVSDITGIPWGKDELIRARPMGQSGTDVAVIGEAKSLFPYSTECKDQRTFSIPAWIEQSKSNQEKDTDWLLVITKNNFDRIAILDAEAFFRLYKKSLDKQ